MKRVQNLAIAAFVLIGLTACGRSDYKIPVINTPKGAASSSADISGWWKSFNDPALTGLIEEALKNNADIQGAAARLEQAKSARSLARATLFPSVDLRGGVSRSKSSVAQDFSVPGQPRHTTLYSADFAASYELDLWGRLAAVRRGAGANLKATAYQQEAVNNLIATETARSYFTLCALDSDEKLLQKTVETRRKSAELQKMRLDAGLINAYEYALVESELNSVAALLPQARTAREQAEIALAALAGRTPQQLVEMNVTRGHDIETLAKVTEIPAALPANLLQRRPDVKAAEELLLAADADVSQARARFFPAITLTESLGGESASLSNLVTSAGSTWNLAALATQPILGLWTTKVRVRGAKAARNEAEISYQQAARQAYADALMSLSRHRAAKEALGEARKLYANESKVRELAEQQLQAGQIGRLNVLDAEREKLSAARALIAAQRERIVSLINVYQALGGGWSETARKFSSNPSTGHPSTPDKAGALRKQ